MPQSATAEIGHNQPPDPIDEALAAYGDTITEAENWLDGETVTTDDQMKAVDALTKEIKEALKSAKSGEESEAKPVYDRWKAIKARWKPTIDDLERIKKGLVALVSDYKRKKAAEQAEAERKAREEAERKRREAEQAARQASEADIEAQRAAAMAQQEAEEAQRAAAKTSKEKVKGMRTVTRYEITDHRALLHWIATHRRDDLTAFIDEWARRNHRDVTADGMRVWQEKEAF